MLHNYLIIPHIVFKSRWQGVRVVHGEMATKDRNNFENQSLLIRLSEPCDKKIRAVRWKNRRALILSS